LRPLRAAMARGAARLENVTRVPERPLRAVERADRLHPGGLEVERLARTLREAVVEDVRVGRIAGEAHAALHVAGVVVEVGDAALDAAPVRDALVGRVPLREEVVDLDRVADAGGEDPRDPVRETVGMAGGAGTPRVDRGLAAEPDRVDVADLESAETVVGRAERRVEDELADLDGVRER